MVRSRVEFWFALALLAGCSPSVQASARDVADANDTGRTFGANTPSERALLARVSTLPSETPTRVGEATVVADAPYDAASGRRCRALRITQGASRQPERRLACFSGRAWLFVPAVFSATGATQ